MKKHSLLLSALLGLTCMAYAQTDSTQTKPVLPVTVPADSLPSKPSEPAKSAEPIEEVEESSQPRIIYYQDSKPSYRNRRDDIKTLTKNSYVNGSFFGLSFRASEFQDETLIMGGIRTGWILNRTLGIGLDAHGVIPTAHFDNIYPDQSLLLLGGYGGMFLEFILFSNQVIHVTAPISGGAGWLGYMFDTHGNKNNPNYVDYNGKLLDEDVFWYVEPGVNLEMNISKRVRLAFGVSKRFTQDLNLVTTKSAEFEKKNFYVTLKWGRF